MTYILFPLTAAISFYMGWHWGYGHGRQIGKAIGHYEAGKTSKPA